MVGEFETILRTTNGGETWLPQSSPISDVSFLDVQFTSSKHGIIHFIRNGLLVSNDGGESWDVLEGGMAGRDLYFVNADTGFVVGDGIYRTTDGGRTWTEVLGDPGYRFNAVHFANASSGLAVGLLGLIFHTRDGGLTWESQASSTGNTLWDVFLTSSDDGWVVGHSGTILHTSTGGVVSVRTVDKSRAPEIPNLFSLRQNYPNPFNGATSITFVLNQAGKVRLKVFDLQGREVTTLLDDELSIGEHRVVWEARKQASGVYFYRLAFLATGGFERFTETRKLLFLK